MENRTDGQKKNGQLHEDKDQFETLIQLDYLNGEFGAKLAMKKYEENLLKKDVAEVQEDVAEDVDDDCDFTYLPEVIRRRLKNGEHLCPGFYIPSTSSGAYTCKLNGFCYPNLDSAFERLSSKSKCSNKKGSQHCEQNDIRSLANVLISHASVFNAMTFWEKDWEEKKKEFFQKGRRNAQNPSDGGDTITDDEIKNFEKLDAQFHASMAMIRNDPTYKECFELTKKFAGKFAMLDLRL